MCLGEDPAATGHLFLVFLEPPLAFLASILELPHASLQVSQPLLAFGQLYFCFGGLAAFDLPLRFEFFGPSGQLLQLGFHLGQQSLRFVLLRFRGVQCPRGLGMFGFGGSEFRLSHAVLAVDLRSTFLGGRYFVSLLAGGLARLSMFLLGLFRAPAAGIHPLADYLSCGRRPAAMFFHLGSLQLQGPQLASSRDKSGRSLSQPNGN